MKRALRKLARWTLRGVIVVLALGLSAATAVVVVGGRAVRAEHTTSGHAITIPDDSVSVAEGGRLAAIHGCTGCHRQNGAGGVMFETPLGDRIVSADLTRVVHEYTPEELERVIRHGIRPDGHSVAVMPSTMFSRLSDRELGRILAFLRTLPAVPDSLPSMRLGLLARFLLLRGEVFLEADSIDQARPHRAVRPAGGVELGRYVALTSCTECHGTALQGGSDDVPPDLRIAASYSPELFKRLMRTGIARDGTERGLMTEVARGRFAHFTDDEIEALYGFLRARARE